MPLADIEIRGAREHNLRGVDVVLPRNQLICLTGVSGSGKSSLAFDTVYAEGQRRYMESLSSYARQFLRQLPKPELDFISGLSPSISISQKSSGTNPRSTVGTITEISDFLRVLYARVGDGFCPQCNRAITAQTREQILTAIVALPDQTRYSVLAPLIRQQKGEYKDLFEDLRKQGFSRARVDGREIRLTDPPDLDRQLRHDIDVVIDRLTSRSDIRPRLAEAVDVALKLTKGTLIVATSGADSTDANSDSDSGHDKIYSMHYACTHCGISFESPSPQLFSFNSPRGMCTSCDGLGEQFSFDPALLVPDASLSFVQGCFELIGPWKDLGRWRRHIYKGVAATIEQLVEWPRETLLKTSWCEWPEELRHLWLWGLGDRNVTYTWRGGKSPIKYGGKFAGIIPELKAKYRQCKSKPLLRKLERYMQTIPCPECGGDRLVAQARHVRLTTGHSRFASRPSRTLPEISQLSIKEAAEFFSCVELDEVRQLIAHEALKEIRNRLGFLINVGLNYLTLNRTAPSLSGGESQRIRLASQIGSGLVGVLYILDEPSIGLHPRDNQRLLQSLRRLRDMGNTVVVVEHDEETMLAADHLIDFGPGPGVRGGHVVAAGRMTDIVGAEDSVTGKYLAGDLKIEVPRRRRSMDDRRLAVRGARHNNLKDIDVEIPIGAFVCVTGVSGSGKSSLVNDILVEVLRRDLNRGVGQPGEHGSVEGLEFLDKMIAIDQSPIGRMPTSNPATYIKVFDEVRNLFARLPESKQRGYSPGRFSFNVARGRCSACKGNGANRVEMDFLADIWVTCPICEGHRYNRETLQIQFKGRSVADVLEMDVQQALELFENIPKIRQKLQTLHDVGLDYIKLGQPSPTLSGGEAQRIKLARELVKRSTGKTLYLLDEPTTGLHFADIRLLLDVLHNFVDSGNTVLVVEHNLDVIKTADWIIDLGPEGGDEGGVIVSQGTPEQVAACDQSYTGRALAEVLADRPVTERSVEKQAKKKRRPSKPRAADNKLIVRGAEQHNLKSVDLELRRERMTVFCGPSGSGKSSLAMNTIYAEGQRRYVESLSSYARQFVSQIQKPAVEQIEGLSPAIAIEQKNLGHTPRSTVGTVTEVYDYLRILFARLGTPYCPDCDAPIGTQTADQIVDKILELPADTRVYLLAPVDVNAAQDYGELWRKFRADGYQRVRVDGLTYSLAEPPSIDRYVKHQVDIVVDRLVVKRSARGRIAEGVEHALVLTEGLVCVAVERPEVGESEWPVQRHSQYLACDRCGRSFPQLTPHNFSFNSSLGWCPHCEGLGVQTGADVSSLVSDPKLTLAQGALLLWPDVSHQVSRWMLDSLSDGTGTPIDVPYERLSARHRRVLLHGAGDRWFRVPTPGARDDQSTLFRFQFKGLYPALSEASHLSVSIRHRVEGFISETECSACMGSRLRDDAAAMRFQEMTLDEICRLPLGELIQQCERWRLTARDRKIAGEVIREITGRIRFLNDVGLNYVSLSRGAATLSNGEAQRIRLASQLGSGLCGVMYVLDEPTIGLHPRDNQRLLAALHKLRDLGNTLIVVEHDREVIEGADFVCDFGPGAGREGGQVTASGTPRQLGRRRASLTGQYLSGKRAIPIPDDRRVVRVEALKESVAAARQPSDSGVEWESPTGSWLEIVGARHNNLKNIDVRLPLGAMTVVTGASGSGKSSLIDEILYPALARRLHGAYAMPGAHDELRGVEHVNKVIRVDQQALGNSPSSNPATYTKVFDLIRNLFAELPEAKIRGYSARRFSFNAVGGRCEKCEGDGQICIEMHFLPDVWVTCESCNGARYNPETLSVTYHGQSISDVLNMPCGDAARLFSRIPKIRRILQTLCDVGLSYLTLGQPAPTLSGGEAQRVKLAAELARPDTGRTLYLLDEPTTGLHFDDLAKLLDVLHRLVDLGNTVVLIEHNLDVIKSADWVVDMGPEAGIEGGSLVCCNTPEGLVDYARRATGAKSKRASKTVSAPRSYTGEALAPVLEAGPYAPRVAFDAGKELAPKPSDLQIDEIGRDSQMPWELDGRQWHVQDRVDRQGKACRWEGRILAEVVDKIQDVGEFAETNWNHRSIVEITGQTKSLGWFFHAITAETWLLKMKFRVARNTFRKADLLQQISLKTLNQMDDLPIYGNESRVTCKSLRGPWQEVQLKVHSWEEINTPEFWQFLEAAVAGFDKFAQLRELKPEDHMPWKKLGQRWHFMNKGFSPGKRPRWEMGVWEELYELLCESVPNGQFLWNNQVLVHMFVPNMRSPWATVCTKRLESLDLVLTGPKESTTMGRIADLAWQRELDTSQEQVDVVKLRFRVLDDLGNGDLATFLQEHVKSIGADDVSRR